MKREISEQNNKLFDEMFKIFIKLTLASTINEIENLLLIVSLVSMFTSGF